MNTKNNRKAKLSKEKIQNALLDIIKNKEYQISIKYLCEVAKINRTTFYSHYDSVEDILYEMCGGYITKACDIFLDKTISYQESGRRHIYSGSQTLSFLWCDSNIHSDHLIFRIRVCFCVIIKPRTRFQGHKTDNNRTKD